MQVLPIASRQELASRDDRRRHLRGSGSIEAHLVAAGREPCEALLTEMSPHGCCAQTEADWLWPGRFVAIVPFGEEPLECIVRWTRDGTAGLELLRPLPASYVDWLTLVG